jgi:hypothetical protein
MWYLSDHNDDGLLDKAEMKLLIKGILWESNMLNNDNNSYVPPTQAEKDKASTK